MPTGDKKRLAHQAMVTRVLEGDGKTPRTQRRAAFDNTGLAEPLKTLVNKVAQSAYKFTDEDIDAVRASGLSEDPIFELVVCAAIGQATRQYESGVVALKAAIEKR